MLQKAFMFSVWLSSSTCDSHIEELPRSQSLAFISAIFERMTPLYSSSTNFTNLNPLSSFLSFFFFFGEYNKPLLPYFLCTKCTCLLSIFYNLHKLVFIYLIHYSIYKNCLGTLDGMEWLIILPTRINGNVSFI